MTVLDGELAVPCSPQPAPVGVEYLAEAFLFLGSVRVSGDEGRGPGQRAPCKPRQDRKVATVAGRPLVLSQPCLSKLPG